MYAIEQNISSLLQVAGSTGKHSTKGFFARLKYIIYTPVTFRFIEETYTLSCLHSPLSVFLFLLEDSSPFPEVRRHAGL